MAKYNRPDNAYSLPECIKVMVDRQLNLALNKPGHSKQVLTTLRRQNDAALKAAFAKAWGI